ncbi:hypothetical protein F4780DRAFT_781238 [Xylariomycetidae sp. FL0641]|nr:hypothetical protein F4780DRAFT_781238 [Xylariomycetidae sp. FL0641]
MTEPVAPEPQPSTSPADHPSHADNPPPFAPIFTLVNNTSTRTTHHPHVRYIFSDDDPDILTQALADHDTSNDDGSKSDPSAPSHNRAMILDLAPDAEGGYEVAWSSSLSPSWAVLNAQVSQVSQVSPPSSEGGNSNGSGNGGGDDGNTRPNRLMLRIEGVESSALGSEADLRISDQANRQGSGSGSGSGSSQRDRGQGESENYTGVLSEFDKRMATLRKVVSAGEDRRRKIGAEPPTEPEGQPEPTRETNPPE